jgi:hypothetical protein
MATLHAVLNARHVANYAAAVESTDIFPVNAVAVRPRTVVPRSGRTPSHYPGQVENLRRSKSSHRRSNRRTVGANKIIDDDMDSAVDAVA